MNEEDKKPASNLDIFHQRWLGKLLFIVLLVGTVIWVFKLLLPYMNAIVLGAVFATIFHPVYRYIKRKVKGRANLAAGLTCTLVFLVVLVPLISFTSVLAVKGRRSVLDVKEWFMTGGLKVELRKWTPPDLETKLQLDTVPEKAEKTKVLPPRKELDEKKEGVPATVKAEGPTSETKLTWKQRTGGWILRRLPEDSLQQVKDNAVAASTNAGAYLASKAMDIAGKGVSMIITFFLMIFVMFYFFRDGARLTQYLIELSPMDDAHERMILNRLKSVAKSAIIGTSLTAVVQGALGMMAFAVVGIQWFFWGVVMAFASLIPVVGTALVWVPCCLYLLLTGQIAAAVGLAVWCIVVVGFSDNLLRPLLMQGDTGMSSIIAFFAILGGIHAFGLIGVIYGPLIFGFCAMLLYIFKFEMCPPSAPRQNRKRRQRKRRRRDNRQRNDDRDDRPEILDIN